MGGTGSTGSVSAGAEQPTVQGSSGWWRERWPWVIATILFMVNLLWTGSLALSHDKALNDRLNYYLTARTLATGGGLAVPAKSDLRVPDQTSPYAVGERPLFPFLASLAIRLTGSSVQATNFVSALMRSLALLPIFALALRLFGRWTAVGTAVLYTLSPPWTGSGATTMTETTFGFFYYLTLLLATLYWQRPTRLLALLMGLAFTLTVMAREEGLVLGLGLVAILLWRDTLQQRSRDSGANAAQAGPRDGQMAQQPGFLPRARALLSQRRLLDLTLFLVGPLIGFIGQKVYLWRNFGSLSSAAHPLFFNSEYEFLYALRLQTWREYLTAIGGVGGAIAARVFNNLSQFLVLFADGLILDSGQAGLFPLTFLLPVAIGIWEMVRGIRGGRSRSRVAGLLFVATLLHGLAWPSFLGRWRPSELRHIQAITPFLMILAAYGLVLLWRKSRLGRGLVVLLVGHYLVFAFLHQTLLIDVLAVDPPYNTADIQALRQVQPELDSQAILMSRKPARAALYAERPAVMMPLAGFRDLMSYAQDHGVTHLVVQPRELRTRPGLAEGLAAFPEIDLKLAVGRTQIYEVQGYAFLDSIPADSSLASELDLTVPSPPPDWAGLLRRAEPSTLSQVYETWTRWWSGEP
jgi:hypothetical protein